MNLEILERRLAGVKRSGAIPERHIEALRQAATQCQVLRQPRIDAIRLGRHFGLSDDEAINLFVTAARHGVFDFTWALICPSCGGILKSGGTINDIDSSSVFCHICNVDVPLVMDDCVEVSFAPHPDIHRIDLDPTESFDTYRAAHFSAAIEADPRFQDYLSSIFRGFHAAPAHAGITISLPAFADDHLRLVSAALHHQLNFRVLPQAPAPNVVTVSISGRRFVCADPVVGKGDLVIRVINDDDETVPFSIFATDFAVLHRRMVEWPPRREPFLTGKMLLNNQTFRRLYRIQNLVPGLKLNVRSLTILFTDLKGSTELYDHIGDVEAYQLIQNHFAELTAAVGRQGGAVIKTMGDAIMAAFSEPRAGVSAALDMMEGVRRVRTGDGEALGLKVGLHEGPALAINNDGALDYFGQTVNIAARVQGLAASGEIWLTETVMSAAEVSGLLRAVDISSRSVPLKGVGGLTRVFRCCPHPH